MPASRVSPFAAALAVALLASLAPFAATRAALTPDRDAEAGWTAQPVSTVSSARPRDRALLATLPRRTKVGYHPGTGRVRLLSGTPADPLSGPVARVASGGRDLTVADARSRARGFLERYGTLFGLSDPAAELRAGSAARHGGAAADEERSVPATRAARARSGATSDARKSARASTREGAIPANVIVRFDQRRSGLPVMGGQIVVQVSGDGAIVSAAGEVLPSATSVTVRPRLGAAQAAALAATVVAREAGLPSSAVRTRSEGLAIYDARIMGDPVPAAEGARLAWRIDARLPGSASHAEVHRLIVVDARLGLVLSSIGRLASVDRYICDNRNAPGRSYKCDAPFARTEGRPATGVSDVDAVYRLMGVVDGYFRSRFGRNGLDGKGARLRTTVRYCQSYGCPWRNAEWKWSDQQSIFGTGWARADDIVAHELTHGLLDHEVPLFYQYQSGAINESMADVFGELIDLSYAGGRDTAGTRWLIGEDTPIGAFRDMQDPPRHRHPDRVRSRLWHTGASDDGGVHRNSGVGNKAASLIADGGRFNGYRVGGIGLARTARIYYQAITTRLTPAANYIDLADALVSACADLAGSQGITLKHCASVRAATRATEMTLQPRQWAPRQAPVCSAGSRPLDVFADDLEDPSAGLWASQRLVGTRKGWYYPQNPNNDPTWDGTWASSGKRNLYAPDHGVRMDSVMQMTTAVELPERAFLRFEHGYSFDLDAKRRYDGGIVEIKVGAGDWRGVADRFTHGGYARRLTDRTGNPLGGRKAFTGNSHGWSAARVDLSDFAGKTVKVRFRMASDRAVGGHGWYIDDIRIYSCARDTDRPTGSLLIDDGAAVTADSEVRLAISAEDATSWVTQLRVSGSSRLREGGLLDKGITVSIRDALSWDLADTTYGGSGKSGDRRVYAQVQDAAGHWSDVFSDAIELRP